MNWNMRLEFILVLLTSLLCSLAYSQQYKLPPILEKLKSVPGVVNPQILNDEPLIKILDLPIQFQNESQILIKAYDDLLLCIPGTGRVYKLDENSGLYNWIRIDSTFYTGYNFGCLFFFLDSTLYSFGGTGFWHFNGDLRFYNPKNKEWGALPLSENIHRAFFLGDVYKNFYQVDTINKRLYILGPTYKASYVFDQSKGSLYANKLYALDIKSGFWKCIGNMQDTSFKYLIPTPFGLYINHESILNIEKNSYFKLSKSHVNKASALYKSTSNNEFDIAFCVDSTIYFGDFDSRIDSLQLHASDLLDSGIKVYNPLKQDIEYMNFISKVILILLLISGCIYLIWFILRVRRKRYHGSVELDNNGQLAKESDSNSDNEISFPIDANNHFEIRELDLIKFIWNNSSKGDMTSIDEINKVIGVSQRAIEIQKRLRSDIVISINNKFSLLTGKKDPLLKKRRSVYDKRSFEYYINSSDFDAFQKLFNR